MSDTPEACPFCGAGKSDLKSEGANRFKCGTHWWRDGKPFRNYACYENELAILRPKAVAYDRLEEMEKQSPRLRGSSVYWHDDIDGKWFEVRVWTEDDRSITGTGPDLASAIEAAHRQFKKTTP